MSSAAASSGELREIQLIQRAATGDGDAFGLLFEKHFQTIYNYVLWLCNDPDQAEDLTQETFIRAHKTLSQLGPPWRIKPWLYRLAHNLFIDFARQKKPVHPLDPDAPIPSNEDNPERQIMAAELSGPVRGALGRLAPNYREALVLREVQGFPYAEIAEVMGLSVDHVKVLLHRARASFKDHYGIGLLAEKQAARCNVLNEMLDAFHDGELTSAQEEQVRQHVKDCAACQQRRREMAALLVLLGGQRIFNLPARLHQTLLNTPNSAGLAGSAGSGGAGGAAGLGGAAGAAGAAAGRGRGGPAADGAARGQTWSPDKIRKLAAVGGLGAGIALAAWLMIHFSFISLPTPGLPPAATPTTVVDAVIATAPPTESPTPTVVSGASVGKNTKPGVTAQPGGASSASQCFCEVNASTNAWDGNYVCATANGVTVSSVVNTTKCPPPVCGNGVVEGGEQCDTSGKGCGAGASCNADCTCGQPVKKPPTCTCIPIKDPTTGKIIGGYCRENRAQKCTP